MTFLESEKSQLPQLRAFFESNQSSGLGHLKNIDIGSTSQNVTTSGCYPLFPIFLLCDLCKNDAIGFNLQVPMDCVTTALVLLSFLFTWRGAVSSLESLFSSLSMVFDSFYYVKGGNSLHMKQMCSTECDLLLNFDAVSLFWKQPDHPFHSALNSFPHHILLLVGKNIVWLTTFLWDAWKAFVD